MEIERHLLLQRRRRQHPVQPPDLERGDRRLGRAAARALAHRAIHPVAHGIRREASSSSDGGLTAAAEGTSISAAAASGARIAAKRRDLIGRAAEAGTAQQMRRRARAERSVVRLQRRGEIEATLRTQDAADVDLSLGGHRC